MNNRLEQKLEAIFCNGKDHVCKWVETQYGSSDLTEVGYECEICRQVVEPSDLEDIYSDIGVE